MTMARAGQIRTDHLDAQHEARRRLALSQIRQYPDPVLRMRAREVELFDDDLARLAQRMTELMTDAAGVGLAANHVGVLQRLFVIQLEDEEPPTIVVNPRITPVDTEQATENEACLSVDEEGCLSVQGVLVPVERAAAIKLEAKDVRGEEITFSLEGLAARAAQHELDHLDGVLIIDRTTPEARRQALAALRPKPVVGVAG